MIPYLDYGSNISKFDVEAYKLTGKAEQTHGDIAVVVSRSFPHSSHRVSGVGFYEAKARSLVQYNYPSFSIQQLRRLVTSTQKLSYLLYSKESQVSDSKEWPTLQNPADYKYEGKKYHALTADANLLKQCKDIDSAAHIAS